MRAENDAPGSGDQQGSDSSWGRPAGKSPPGQGLDLRGLESAPAPKPEPAPTPASLAPQRMPWWRNLLVPGGVSVFVLVAAILLAVAEPQCQLMQVLLPLLPVFSA